MELVTALVIVIVVAIVGLLVAWHVLLPVAVEMLAGKAIARLDRAVAPRVARHRPPVGGAEESQQ